MKGLSLFSLGMFLIFNTHSNAQYSPTEFTINEIPAATIFSEIPQLPGAHCGCIININCSHKHFNARVVTHAENNAYGGFMGKDLSRQANLLSANKMNKRSNAKGVRIPLAYQGNFPVFVLPSNAMLLNSFYDKGYQKVRIPNPSDEQDENEEGTVNIRLAEKLWLTMDFGFFQAIGNIAADSAEDYIKPDDGGFNVGILMAIR